MFLTIVLVLLSIAGVASEDSRPNIVLIVVDDMGYTDMGAFGGEIKTPNLDALAFGGLRLTNFYTAPTCSPTRAMLMTGVDNHLVGLGNMKELLSPNQKGRPGYEGYLNKRAASMAEILKREGYNTYMTGKWHLGFEESQSPAGHGFERSFALLNGGGGHFDNLGMFGTPATYRRDGRMTALPEDFYSTRFYTEEMIRYLEKDRGNGKPFFAYLAFSAPHWPLQAPEESIARYRGRYDRGYDHLQGERLKGAVEQGVVAQGAKLAPRFPGERAWDALNEEERRVEARKMEIYAAMVDDVDRYVGELVEYLVQVGEYDDTIIFFMSDNGAEGHEPKVEYGFGGMITWIEKCCDNSYENLGRADSYVMLGPNWARATGAPFKHFKGATSEGGIRAPAFLSYSRLAPSSPLSSRFVSVKDVMPTLLSMAGVQYAAGAFSDRTVVPPSGSSFLDQAPDKIAEMGWELAGKRAYRYGDWKVVFQPEPWGNGKWQLYNLKQDPAEEVDLANTERTVLEQLVQRWESYAQRNGVVLPDRVSGY
nr:arylsulfatase [Parahaliea mediterranea]